VEECGEGKKRGIGSNKMAQKKEQEKRIDEMKKGKERNRKEKKGKKNKIK
jgi:hypothetical protein